MKLRVKPEGRDGVWLAEKKNVALWIRRNKWAGNQIHNMKDGGAIFLGADWGVDDVIDCVKKCDRIAILTGDAQRQNMNHALAVITKDGLDMFDIGKIVENDLQISA